MVKIRSMKIENLNDETTPGKPNSQFVPINVGDHPKIDSHQNLSTNSNHIACNKPDKNNKINTHIEIEMTNAI